MNTAVINVKVNPEIKKRAQKTASQIGVSLSDVINASLREFIERKSVTFRAPEEPSDFLIKSLEESTADIKAGRVSPGFTNAKDAIAWLDKQDKKYARKIRKKI